MHNFHIMLNLLSFFDFFFLNYGIQKSFLALGLKRQGWDITQVVSDSFMSQLSLPNSAVHEQDGLRTFLMLSLITDWLGEKDLIV